MVRAAFEMLGSLAGVLITLVAAESRLPSFSRELLSRYFARTPGGNHFYFCETADAVEAFRSLENGKLNTNTRVLASNPSTKAFLDDDDHPQRMGVFLDLSCPEGYHVLDQAKDAFNATYRWLFWSDDLEKTLNALKPTRLEVDSDVTAMSPGEEGGVRVFSVSRIHFKAPFVVTEISTAFDPVSDERAKPDFQGYLFTTSLMMIDIKFNTSNLLEPLLDRSFSAGSDMVRRYGLSLFLHMAEYYNYTMSYVLTDAWGAPIGNGSWSGMIGQVHTGEAEFGLAPAKYTTPRYDVIDYVTSLHIVRACFTFLQPKLFGTYKALVLPLSTNVWFSLGFCALANIVAFRLLASHYTTSSYLDGWAGSSFLVVGALTNQGIPDITKHLSTRIVYVVVLMASFFVGAYYNAAILNGLLLQAPNAIQNIEQLLQSDIRLALLDIPYFHDEMTHNDTMTLRVKEKVEKHKPPYYFSVTEGVAKIRKGQFALYTEDEAIYHEIANTMSDAEVCSVSEVEKYNPFHVGAVARHNSPYKELFNRGYLVFCEVPCIMRERGIMDRQKKFWLLSKPGCHWKQDTLSLGLEPLFLAYLCLIFGTPISLFILFLEVLLYKRSFRMIKNFVLAKLYYEHHEEY